MGNSNSRREAHERTPAERFPWQSKPEWREGEFADWVLSVDFAGVPLSDALHLMMSRDKRIPREAQPIDRCLERFAEHYVECNDGFFVGLPGEPLAITAADVHILVFAVLMLNTDQHTNPGKPYQTLLGASPAQHRYPRPQTAAEFVGCLRGSRQGAAGDPDGNCFPEQMLLSFYEGIRSHPLGTVSVTVPALPPGEAAARRARGELIKPARPAADVTPTSVAPS